MSEVIAETPLRRQVEISDPKAIRALAHDARLKALSELYASQASRTATELAVLTGLTPSAMSYHLRALQKWGMVVPAESDGDARERRWKAAGTHYTIKSISGSEHPELAIMDLELDAQRRRVLEFNRERDHLRAEDPESAVFPSAVFRSQLMYLDEERAADLIRKVRAVFEEFEFPIGDENSAGVRRVSGIFSIVPEVEQLD